MLEAQSFYSDIDGSPAGTQFDSCYVMLTVEGTGQQACRRRPKSARRLAPQRAV